VYQLYRSQQLIFVIFSDVLSSKLMSAASSPRSSIIQLPIGRQSMADSPRPSIALPLPAHSPRPSFVHTAAPLLSQSRRSSITPRGSVLLPPAPLYMPGTPRRRSTAFPATVINQLHVLAIQWLCPHACTLRLKLWQRADLACRIPPFLSQNFINFISACYIATWLLA